MDRVSDSSSDDVRPSTRFDDSTAIDGLLVNPFLGKNSSEMLSMIKTFLTETGLEAHASLFHKAAFLSQSPNAFSKDREDGFTLDREERNALHDESSNSRSRWTKWRQTPLLYATIACCSIGATVQGWDETAVNAAQLWWREDLGIPSPTKNLSKYNDITGLINSAPYLCAALVGCWLTEPLNRYLGRRGAIFISCAISCATCVWQALTNTWPQMFIARLFLGIGIGVKSATVPIYASECTPKQIRGALVMMWQMSQGTAFGIMCGYIAGVIFAQSKNWRLVIGSPCILPVVVCAYVYTLPESPRWLIQAARRAKEPKQKQKYLHKAWRSFERLRRSRLQAARDMFLVYHMLENESKIRSGRNRFAELFTNDRNRRAIVASTICLFFQQFCGVNLYPYYSSQIFNDTSTTDEYNPQVTLLSLGFGIINFVFAIPAVPMIDSFGRRVLLLATFPFMAAFQLMIGLAYTAKNETTRKALVATGMYLFSVAYSPGEGPVPFLYASESLPMYCRDLGMSFATAITWLFNFLLSVTFPRFLAVFGHTGAFAYYAAWCVVGFILILLYVPETRNQTLEELDATFSVPSRVHARYGIGQLRWFVLRFVFLRRGAKRAVLRVRVRDETVASGGRNDTNTTWEPRYVVFGKDSGEFESYEMEPTTRSGDFERV